MQNLNSSPKSCSRFIISLGSELRYFSQCERRQKQQKEPCHAADVSAEIRPEKPCNGGNCQNNNGGESPAAIGCAGPPRTSENEQRRNDRKEKQDVIEIHP